MSDDLGPPLVLAWTVAVCALCAFWWTPEALWLALTFLGTGAVLGLILYAPVASALIAIRQWADMLSDWRSRD